METILVVDDDAQVLAIVGKMLEGYRILNALNAEEAVRVATAHVGPIHLLFERRGDAGSDWSRAGAAAQPSAARDESAMHDGLCPPARSLEECV